MLNVCNFLASLEICVRKSQDPGHDVWSKAPRLPWEEGWQHLEMTETKDLNCAYGVVGRKRVTGGLGSSLVILFLIPIFILRVEQITFNFSELIRSQLCMWWSGAS